MFSLEYERFDENNAFEKAKLSLCTTKFELIDLLAKAGGELFKVDDAVVVPVELGEQVDAILLQAGIPGRLLLNLVQDILDVLLGEHVRVVLHVLLRVLICADHLETEAAQNDGTTDQEVLFGVVGARDRVLVILALHKFAANAATVLVTHLIDEDGVVTTEERDNEFTVLIVRLSRHELGVKAEDMHILLEHLLHVGLGCLRLQVRDRGHRVGLCTEALVVRCGLVLDGGWRRGEPHRHLSDAKLALVPLFGPVVAAVDVTVAAVDLNLSATADVSRHVVLLLAEGHSWADGQNG